MALFCAGVSIIAGATVGVSGFFVAPRRIYYPLPAATLSDEKMVALGWEGGRRHHPAQIQGHVQVLSEQARQPTSVWRPLSPKLDGLAASMCEDLATSAQLANGPMPALATRPSSLDD